MADITYEILFTVRKETRTVIHVIQWGKNEPQLEKREYYMANDGLRFGKAKGFSAEDLKLIDANRDDIEKALTGEVIDAEITSEDEEVTEMVDES